MSKYPVLGKYTAQGAGAHAATGSFARVFWSEVFDSDAVDRSRGDISYRPPGEASA